MTVSEGDILKLVLDYNYPGAGTALSVFNYVYGGLDREDEDVMDDIAAAFISGWANIWSGIGSNEATIDNIQGYIVDSDGLVIRDLGQEVIDVTGGVMSTVLPAANAGYIQAVTAIPRVLGKKYAPAVAEDTVDGGVFDAAAIANLILLLDEYVTPTILAGGGTIFPGVVSSKTAGFELFTTAGLVRALPAYQRRRKDNVGS